MGKIINKLFNTLLSERSSLEAGATNFSTHNIVNFLGKIHGVFAVFLFLCLAWLIIAIFVSCGSSKQISSEKAKEKSSMEIRRDSVKGNSSALSSENDKFKVDSTSTNLEQKETSIKDSETITFTETTIYDTSDTTTNAKISKTIKQMKIERRGASTTKTHKETKNTASKEVAKAKEDKYTKSNVIYSAMMQKGNETESSTDKTQSLSESKQTFYIACIIFGVAIVILASVLARWAFSKYRQRN